MESLLQAHSDLEGAKVQTTILTINLCTLVSGATNRFLPKIILYTTVLINLAWSITAWWKGCPIWCCLTLLPPGIFVLMWSFGFCLGRMLGPFLQPFGFDDCKRERVDLFVRALRERPEWTSVDVICVQECYNALICPGGYPEQLARGVYELGFVHAVLPDRQPVWPATFAQNSGLLILSKKPIVRSSALAFGLSLEAANVNRGALYAQLQDGSHIFTCHIAPSASVAGSGFVARSFAAVVEATRARQISALAHFIESNVPQGEPLIIAGDFNLGISFQNFESAPIPSPYSIMLADVLTCRCGLVEATSQVRNCQASMESSEVFACCRPTFAYSDAVKGGPERRLSSYGDGTIQHSCDDAILFRGFTCVEVAEENACIPVADRPHPSITHLSDHWGIRAVLSPL